jgi:hypothetical protein
MKPSSGERKSSGIMALASNIHAGVINQRFFRAFIFSIPPYGRFRTSRTYPFTALRRD